MKIAEEMHAEGCRFKSGRPRSKNKKTLMILELLAYFFAGVLQDTLFTLNQRYVIKNHVISAMLTSFLITIVGLVVLYNILSSLDPQQSIVGITVYAFGVAAGTLLGMKLKIGKEILR